MRLKIEDSEKMNCVLHSTEPLALLDGMQSYFQQRPPDCSLFSQENFEVPVHKEVLYQTPFLQKMLKSLDLEYCCSKIEILCPIVKEDLETLVQFLYSGQIFGSDRNTTFTITKNLTEIFGFPSIDEFGNSESQIFQKLNRRKEISSENLERNEIVEEMYIKQEVEELDEEEDVVMVRLHMIHGVPVNRLFWPFKYLGPFFKRGSTIARYSRASSKSS